MHCWAGGIVRPTVHDLRPTFALRQVVHGARWPLTGFSSRSRYVWAEAHVPSANDPSRDLCDGERGCVASVAARYLLKPVNLLLMTWYAGRGVPSGSTIPASKRVASPQVGVGVQL